MRPCRIATGPAALPLLVAFLTVLMAALVLDAPVRAALNGAPDWLRSAGERVTWLGNSNWMFTSLLAVMAIAVPLAGLSPSPRTRRQAVLALRLAVALFLLILLSGIAVQVLKHLFARARPTHFDDLGAYAFHPLTFQFRHTSFPSGHATTMGALAVFVAAVTPRLWPLAAGMATVVGISRIVVEKHYPSDVVAGLVLGGACACVLVSAWRRTGLLPPSPVRLLRAMRPRKDGKRDRPPGLARGAQALLRAFGQGFAALKRSPTQR
ncbi:phosphatase PAP2 family protein [Roseibacterium beibuensis]|uniref:Phosphatase PAP2 family protein n=1 Tax=[Roseibacterium] beibuensis TaxID=1193142 RepID=A0ABP9KZH0_9RHOB